MRIVDKGICLVGFCFWVDCRGEGKESINENTIEGHFINLERESRKLRARWRMPLTLVLNG